MQEIYVGDYSLGNEVIRYFSVIRPGAMFLIIGQTCGGIRVSHYHEIISFVSPIFTATALLQPYQINMAVFNWSACISLSYSYPLII